MSETNRGPVVSSGGGEGDTARGLLSGGLPALAEIKECAQTRASSKRRRLPG